MVLTATPPVFGTPPSSLRKVKRTFVNRTRKLDAKKPHGHNQTDRCNAENYPGLAHMSPQNRNGCLCKPLFPPMKRQEEPY